MVNKEITLRNVEMVRKYLENEIISRMKKINLRSVEGKHIDHTKEFGDKETGIAVYSNNDYIMWIGGLSWDMTNNDNSEDKHDRNRSITKYVGYAEKVLNHWQEIKSNILHNLEQKEREYNNSINFKV